jgi:hypothetical protein
MTQRAFSLVLQDIRDGRTHSELTASMEELLTAVRNTGKAGSITLEIKVKPNTRGGDIDRVLVTDKVTTKIPKPERGDDFFFVTDDNNLSRNHPRQHSLDLRTATAGAPTQLKEAIQ